MKRMHIYLPMIRLSIQHVEVAGNGTEGHDSSLASWYHFCRQCQELYCSELCPNGSRRDGIDSGVKPSDPINMSICYEAFSILFDHKYFADWEHADVIWNVLLVGGRLKGSQRELRWDRFMERPGMRLIRNLGS
jgi:hypothetical protein